MRQVVAALGVAAGVGAGLGGLAVAAAGLAASAPVAQRNGTGAGIDVAAIDRRVDACTNFYQHACGGFIGATTLTPTRSSVSLAEQKFEANLERSLNALFAIDAQPGSEFDRLATFYRSCLGDQRSSVALARAWLARIDAARTPRDMQDLLLALGAIGVNPFFSYAGAPDPNNLTRYRGEITPSNLWQEPAVVAQAFTLAGVSPAQAAADAEAVRSLVTELREYRSGTPADANRPATLAELQRDAPGIPWPRVFAQVGAAPAKPINLSSRRYLPAVSRALMTQSPAALRAYLRWTFLFSLRGELPAPLNQAFGDITPSLRVALDQPGRRCRDATVRGMGVEFSRQYAHRILGLDARTAAYRIGTSIQGQIVRAVADADWLSPAARRATAQKLQATDLKLGFPDRWPAVSGLVPQRAEFLANVLAARRYEQARAWRRANEARSRKNWDMLVYSWVGSGMAAARLVIPNGFPDADTNSMVMTAAVLNLPYFDKGAPEEINYGGFGFTFAHEFVHVAETHDYGAEGQPQALWSAADLASAKQRRQCVIDQAEAAPAPPGARVSGQFNYSENVADLGAIRLAYNALAGRLGPRITQRDAAGTSPAQRFFYKYAQSYCMAATPETLRQLVADDSHALPEYRVNGPLSNLPAFAEAFGCNTGTPMRRAPEKICRVW